MSRDAENQRALHDAICRRLQLEFKLSEQHASEYASQALEAISQEFGGQRIYVAKPSGKPDITGAELRARLLAGEKGRDLQQQYSLSSSKFYRLLAEGNDDA